jgi:hypothetical protein
MLLLRKWVSKSLIMVVHLFKMKKLAKLPRPNKWQKQQKQNKENTEVKTFRIM